jgi:hypothetical protein
MMGFTVVGLHSHIALTACACTRPDATAPSFTATVYMTTITFESPLATVRGLGPTSTAGLRSLSGSRPEGTATSASIPKVTLGVGSKTTMRGQAVYDESLV